MGEHGPYIIRIVNLLGKTWKSGFFVRWKRILRKQRLYIQHIGYLYLKIQLNNKSRKKLNNLLTSIVRRVIIRTNKYRTVLNGRSNVGNAMTETCWKLRGRMEYGHEKSSRSCCPNADLPVDAAGRQPLSGQALEGNSGDAGKVVVMTIRVVPQSEGFVSF